MATVLFIVTSESIYSTINGCYVNSYVNSSQDNTYLDIPTAYGGVVHSSALALCTLGMYVYMYVMYVCMYVYMYVCMYV